MTFLTMGRMMNKFNKFSELLQPNKNPIYLKDEKGKFRNLVHKSTLGSLNYSSHQIEILEPFCDGLDPIFYFYFIIPNCLKHFDSF